MDAVITPVADPTAISEFVTRWKDNAGSERANFQSFMRELCDLLQLPLPDPGKAENEHNAYVFERFIAPKRADSTTEKRYIDLYKRDCFVLEGKQTGKALATQSHQNAIIAAVRQAERYVRGLPLDEVEHGRPPFIAVVDVGNAIYLFSEFSRTGGNYVAFPDPRHHEIRLDDLHKPEVQDRLRRLWLDPESLDPSRHAAFVTKQVSATLAQLAKSLEHSGFEVERVANFLKRCLFTMFAEDVELLPTGSFHNLLVEIKDRNPEGFPHAVKDLWERMNTGGYDSRMMQQVRRFNGGLFKGIDPIPLNVDQIQLLIDAAKADWRFVEPAIFGTLLERALDPRERHKLGAHYTPRAYVERLVMPTLIEPLREEWGDVRGAAETLLRQGKLNKALEELRAFHYKLCQTRVLDPACGSANFLYVALEHMKRLEGEVLAFIAEQSQGQEMLEAEGLTVDPHQFLGLEINPRAAAIAELVLWIGYLQWHYKLNDRLDLPEPILRDFKNIQCRDALIEYDSREPELDENGSPVTIWDGITMKKSPTTGELIPDETGRATVYRYYSPRRAEWPEADYIIGNPPFIGGWKMRSALGGGYVEALWSVYPKIPQKADFVMYWWDKAADLVRSSRAKAFGFITTNSIVQVFQRRILERHLNDKQAPLSLAFAIPDHPWVDSNDGAAVRIAMTIGRAGINPGVRFNVTNECRGNSEEIEVRLTENQGRLHADLKIGADVSSALPLKSNKNISSPGVQLYGKGFVVEPEKASQLLSQTPTTTDHPVIRAYVNGRDILQKGRGFFVIDFFGMNEVEARQVHPAAFQHVLDHVKPERLTNRRESIRDLWWRFGWERPNLRQMTKGLSCFITTAETARHRIFSFLDSSILPDNRLTNIATDDACVLAVLSSRIHILWAITVGGTLEDRPIYTKATCFETFPFPELNDEQATRTANLAEQIDTHRKRQQAGDVSLTLTDMYNTLEKLRAGEELTAKDKNIHQQGLVSLLGELHDELDRAVFEAYGWPDLAEQLIGRPGATTPLPDKPAAQAEAEEELLIRLVALNKQRAAEEAQGKIRWLRPEYQAPEASQISAELATEQSAEPKVKTTVAIDKGKAIFPKAVPEQLKVLRKALAERPHTVESLADLFKRKPRKSIEEGLLSLAAVGRAEYEESSKNWHISG